MLLFMEFHWSNSITFLHTIFVEVFNHIIFLSSNLFFSKCICTCIFDEIHQISKWYTFITCKIYRISSLRKCFGANRKFVWNCNALINETSALSNEFWPWTLFEESFEDLKLDYFFIFKMVKDVPFERNYYFC